MDPDRTFTVWCDNLDEERILEESFLEHCVKAGDCESFEELRKLCLDANGAVWSKAETDVTSSTRVFRHDVKPHREDSANAHGGCVTVEIASARWNLCYWLNALSMFLYDDIYIASLVNGIVLTRRSSKWLMSIWYTEDATEHDREFLENHLRLLTDSTDSISASHTPPKLLSLLDQEESSSQPKRPVDYDKELKRLAVKYGRRRSLHSDMITILGTMVITAVVTAYRLISWQCVSALASSMAVSAC